MAILEFPPIDLADEYGLLAVGGDLEVSSLLLAYRSGIFPWPMPGIDALTWFAPPKRAVLFFDKFHISRKLGRILKSKRFQVGVNQDTRSVIERCAAAANRKQGSSTWITPEMIGGYQGLARAGYCHSVESYYQGKLVGGLYGVALGAMFAGESMFYEEAEASKAALVYLVEHLRARGATWIDCQQMTPLFEQFGAEEISRDAFMVLLREAVDRPIRLF